MDNIFNFPTTTLVSQNVPKKAFYGRSNDSSLRDYLTHGFESITWLYKLSAATLNVEDSERVHEIDIFYCKMKEDFYSINPFYSIDQLFPRQTLFIIEYDGKLDLLMHHKEKTVVKGEEKWIQGVTELKRDIHLDIDALKILGLSMDSVYYSLLSQVSGLTATTEEEYKEQADLRKQIESLQKQVSTFQKKIRLEKQFNRQMEMNAETRKLKRELTLLNEQLKKKQPII